MFSLIDGTEVWRDIKSYLRWWFSTRGDFAPRRHSAKSGWRLSSCHSQRGPAGTRGQGPGMLLSILQCTERLPTAENGPVKMSVVPRRRSLGLKSHSQWWVLKLGFLTRFCVLYTNTHSALLSFPFVHHRHLLFLYFEPLC